MGICESKGKENAKGSLQPVPAIKPEVVIAGHTMVLWFQLNLLQKL